MSGNVLVTGGAGYVGSHACKALSKAGYTPVTFDNLTSGHKRLVQWGPLEEGDLLDRVRIGEVMSHYRPIAVMHFAAFIEVAESVREPIRYWHNNVQGSLNLVRATVAHEIRHFVFSSSCAVYGDPVRLPIDESHPLAPVNPYGWTKLATEQLLRQCADAGLFNYIAFRYFNAAGADPEGDTGELREVETHLIPLALKAILGTGPELTVFGDDWETPDGTCLRDYIHVSDLADAHVRGLEYLLDGGGSLALNLGTGKARSVRQVLETTKATTERDVPYIVGAKRPGDAQALVADASLASNVLGWRPAFPALEKIVGHAWEWTQGVGLEGKK